MCVTLHNSKDYCIKKYFNLYPTENCFQLTFLFTYHKFWVNILANKVRKRRELNTNTSNELMDETHAKRVSNCMSWRRLRKERQLIHNDYNVSYFSNYYLFFFILKFGTNFVFSPKLLVFKIKIRKKDIKFNKTNNLRILRKNCILSTG